MEAHDLGDHGGEPGAGEVPIWGSDEEPTARSGIVIAFSDGRVTVLQERKLSWREACDGTQRTSAFTRGVEKKAELGLRGRRKVTNRELGTRGAYEVP